MIIETENGSIVAKGRGQRVKFSTEGHRESCGDGTVLCLDCDSSYTTVCVFQN